MLISDALNQLIFMVSELVPTFPAWLFFVDVNGLKAEVISTKCFCSICHNQCEGFALLVVELRLGPKPTDEIGVASCSTGSDVTRKCLSTQHYGKRPPGDYHSTSKNRNQANSIVTGTMKSSAGCVSRRDVPK